MDFEKFEKNNRFQLLRNKILRISDGDLVKKDLISGLMLLSVIAYILGTIKFFWDNFLAVLFNDLIIYATVLHTNIKQLLNYLIGYSTRIDLSEFPELKVPNIGNPFNVFGVLIIRIIIVGIILFVISLMFKQESFINQIIKSLAIIISSVIVYGEYQITIFIGVIIISITLTQLGKGSVYRFLCNIILFLGPLNLIENDRFDGKQINTIKTLVQVLACYIISLIVSVLFKLPFGICLLLVLVLVMRFGLQFQTKNPHLEIILKFIIYVTVFTTVLLTEQIKDSVSIFTVLFALYFALDRFFSLYNEIETLVKKDEINYYLYFDNSFELLEQKYLTDEFLVATIAEIDEIKLLGQLIIRTELDMKDSFEKLLQLIREKRKIEYENYQLLIISLGYRIKKKENGKLTIIDFIKNKLNDEKLLDNQKVFPIEFLVLYGEELKVKKQYKRATKFLRFSGFYSSYHYIESYNECIKKIDNAQN
ncbi:MULTISPECIES: beta-carotene 15,15'-monooxygenase [Streptococcus]|jgi:membrane protein|uniref:Beta-carotene 15,15'-monooxygenase n=1 Tax=Streptococcus vulneris TaxID=2853160 RepID=A0ABS6SXM5_9STRE|nr:beta-carotene 15,15'-monooxygenase [Streptococcus vulneris]MBV7365730.1 beta-carotene 15,15'-monooxygenase [Streptococcus vulneris]